MLGNRKDPLVDITKKVMEKSEKDRQVVEEINKELGIAHRNALPHEKRPAYDEFVAQQLAEETKGSTPSTPREKDLAAKKPPYDKITKADVLKARGVIKQEEVENIDEGGNYANKVKKNVAIRNIGSKNRDANYLSRMNPDVADKIRGREVTQGMVRKEEKDFKGDEAPFEADEKKSTPWKNPASKAKNLARQAMKKMKEKKKLEEAAYSTKAARAGKDIGKPGKMFSKIAKKAGERYGSEERGKKVAGAILAKIRAKHMKEEQVAESNEWSEDFADRYEHLKGHKNPEVKKHVKSAMKSYDDGDHEAAHEHMQKAERAARMSEEQIDEKHLTAAETSKKEELVKKMKKGDWSKRYGERGKSVMYATATKMAKKEAE